MFDLITVLKQYYELEEELSKFYLFLSDLFETDEEASKFFSKLYLEEEQHKSMVLYQMRLIKTNPIHFRNVKMNGVLIKKTKEYLKNYISKKNNFELNDCLKVALVLEACTMESYYSSFFNSLSSELENLTKSMQRESQNHYERVKKFMQKRGYDIPVLPDSNINKAEELELSLDKCFQNL